MLYLVRYNKTYHLRLKLPPDISHILSKQELKFSLKVSRKRLAIKKVSAIRRWVRDLFERMRLRKLEVSNMLAKGELTKDELNQTVREYVIQLIDTYDQDHAFGNHLNSDTIDRELEALDYGIVYCKEQFSERRHKETMGHHVDLLLDGLKISLDKNSESYHMLCYETLKARITVLEADKRKLLADFKGTDKESILKDLGLSVNGQGSGASTTINDAVKSVAQTPEAV